MLYAFSSLLHAQTNYSGIYPHLAMYNDEGECGTGAVVPWAGRLWAITYPPHYPLGSTDKLYEITPDLKRTIRSESIGGTHANRMIHRESNQLFIGPHAIDTEGNVRTIPIKEMPGRFTGNARHLTNPADKIYYATMEEGLYSVNVNTLEVEEHIIDDNDATPPVGNGVKSELHGYHGKGLYSGQGHLFYSNNGMHGRDAKIDPTTTSGALAQWSGEGQWKLIRKNQFTELSGPGGIYGSSNPETDPIWAMGWDARSLLLGLLENNNWTYYRLPKGSHSYDGAHGWNTEWPRIREIGEESLLATMHGTFWHFPPTFSSANSAGIKPRSNYLKVVGDFCKWNNKLVLGCDDSAQKEFLNTRPFKARHAAPKQSNSNLWFIEAEQLDTFGPVIGRGSVWLRENLQAEATSDPYLFSGYDHRQLSITHFTTEPITITLEVDKEGNGQWVQLRQITVAAMDTSLIYFNTEEKATWIRLKTDKKATALTAHFHYRNQDSRDEKNAPLFNGITKIGQPKNHTGVMQSLAYNKLAIVLDDGSYYQMNQQMEFTKIDRPKQAAKIVREVAQPTKSYQVDAASVILRENGRTYRLPKNDHYKALAKRPRLAKICREVATERDLLNIHGTFFELPARNAQGVAKIRPISTHNLDIQDFCSHNGLLLFTGLDAKVKSERIVTSADNQVAIWAGVIDDLWSLGKPRGQGGPWKDTEVIAKKASDPYLMTAYDNKSVEIESSQATDITLEVDLDGTGLWVPYHTFQLEAGQRISHQFPKAFSAYWVRAISDASTTATVWFTYN